MPVFPAASDGPLGRGFGGQVAFTRPSDTTAYSAFDVVGDTGGSAILSLPHAGPRGGMVQVQSVSLAVGVAGVPAGMGAFRLHFYAGTPTAIADNAAFDLVAGDVGIYRGYVDLPTPFDQGSILWSQVDFTGRAMRLADGSTSLSMILQTVGSYTPASATVYTVRVAAFEVGY